jgi:hypothetical protein
MPRSILDLKYKQRQPELIKPLRRGTLRCEVEFIADIAQLQKHYGTEYVEQFEQMWQLTGGKRTDEYVVTLRPDSGDHVVIINRFRWRFTGIEKDRVFFGGRGGYVKRAIALSDWKEIKRKAGVHDESANHDTSRLSS